MVFCERVEVVVRFCEFFGRWGEMVGGGDPGEEMGPSRGAGGDPGGDGEPGGGAGDGGDDPGEGAERVGGVDLGSEAGAGGGAGGGGELGGGAGCGEGDGRTCLDRGPAHSGLPTIL